MLYTIEYIYEYVFIFNFIKNINNKIYTMIHTTYFIMDKKIIITNKSAIQKIKKKKLKREVSKQWHFDICYSTIIEVFDYTLQLEILNTLYMDICCIKKEEILNIQNTEISKKYVFDLFQKEIKKKLQSYIQQDKEKKMYNKEKCFEYEDILEVLVKQKLKCSYCKCEMYILYDNYRCNTQWSLDRIDNTIGHLKENCVVSCLHCNLQKRRMDDNMFRFTKQMKIIKL